MKELLAEAPLEFTAAAAQKNVVLEVPMQDGTIVRFRIEESPMLAPAIAAQFPTWKTFSGQGVEDSTMTARFDINANGFHGYVMTANGTFLIDPYSLTDRKNYIVYYKGNLTEGNAGFSCNVKENKEKGIEFFSSFAPGAFSNGSRLRNFRLAVTATKEYTNFFGGTPANALAAIQTTV